MSKCNHVWVMYTDLTVHCEECDESRNGDELLTELQETIEELEAELKQLRLLVYSPDMEKGDE